MTHSSLPLLALTLLPLLAACSVKEAAAKKPQPEAKPVGSLATATAGTKTVSTTVPLTGTLKANRESALAADVTGRVIAVHIERGSRVRKGDIIAQIDRRGAQFALAEASAHMAVAQTRSAQATLECQRAEKLFGARAIAEAEYQATKSQCEAAAHGVTAAAVKSQLAQKAVGDSVIRAPFDAFVAERFVNPGEFVGFESRVAVLVELEKLRLELSVPENVLEASKPGSEVRFRVAAYPSETFGARVRFVGASVRPSTRDLLVEAEVSNPELKLRPGMFATAEVAVGEVTLPSVPASAIRSDKEQGTDRLFIVANREIEERLVQLGPSVDGFVSIRSGLRAGERFVLEPNSALADGQRLP